MENENGAAVADQTLRSRVIKANRNTWAPKWNLKILRSLEAALRKDPEADMAALLPSKYSENLKSFKLQAPRAALPRGPPDGSGEIDDMRNRLDPVAPFKITIDLSAEVKSRLPSDGSLPEAILQFVDEGEVLYTGPWRGSGMVVRVSETLVAKISPNEAWLVNESQSLSYILENMPAFPVPKPHGVISLGIYSILFTTFVAGVTLEKAWPQLTDSEKHALSCGLDVLFSDLRSMQMPEDTPLGSIHGGRCQDVRRDVRTSSSPIMTVKQFEEFLFAGCKTVSPVYIQLLRELRPTGAAKCVFTHGDIRPANIMVDRRADGTWEIASAIDWGFSGWYPEWWECVKMTNNLVPSDRSDWYNYLPRSLGPRQFPLQWLVDLILDRNMSNS